MTESALPSDDPGPGKRAYHKPTIRQTAIRGPALATAGPQLHRFKGESYFPKLRHDAMVSVSKVLQNSILLEPERPVRNSASLR